jgi:thiamine-monophosphate kinase
LVGGVSDIETLISGGDDYEILCAIPEQDFDAFTRAAEAAGVATSLIGTFVEGAAAPQFLDETGRELLMSRGSYSHF